MTNRIEQLVAAVNDDLTLAAHLGCSVGTLWHIAKQRRQMYSEVRFLKHGRNRRLFVPSGPLRSFQKKLRTKLLVPLCRGLGPHVTGHREGKSTLDAARIHLRTCDVCDATSRPSTDPIKHACPRAGVKFKVVLKDLFLVTRRSWIRRYFHDRVGFDELVCRLLGHVLTTNYTDKAHRERSGVPEGALTSAQICNLVADWRLDGPLIAGLPGWRYTRHLDSLYFSHDLDLPREQVDEAAHLALQIISGAGYRATESGAEVQRTSKPQRVLGININRKLNMPVSEYRALHHLLVNAKKSGFEAQLRWTKKATVPALHSWIAGKLHYFEPVAPEKTAKLYRLYDEAKAAWPRGASTPVSLNLVRHPPSMVRVLSRVGPPPLEESGLHGA